MQNNTAFNALSENHCKYTELDGWESLWEKV
jgi:hypothetical protein